MVIGALPFEEQISPFPFHLAVSVFTFVSEATPSGLCGAMCRPPIPARLQSMNAAYLRRGLAMLVLTVAAVGSAALLWIAAEGMPLPWRGAGTRRMYAGLL